MGPPYMRLKSVYMRSLGVFNGIWLAGLADGRIWWCLLQHHKTWFPCCFCCQLALPSPSSSSCTSYASAALPCARKHQQTDDNGAENEERQQHIR